MIFGVWAHFSGKNYVAISDNHSLFTTPPFLMIAVGLFVLIVGGVGAVGGLFASTTCGRVLLGLVSGPWADTVYPLVSLRMILCWIPH